MSNDCVTLAPLLGAQRMSGTADATRLAEHLAGCATCRDIAAMLAHARRATTSGDGPDLWPRLRTRLAEIEDRIPLVPPRFSWIAAAALALVVAGPLLADEPARFLALLVGMV